jgi:pyrophosphatase PpaX
MAIKGILFDFDGTLANTTPLILHCFRITFEHFFGRVPSDQAILGTFGLPMPKAMLALNGGNEAMLQDMLNYYRSHQLAIHDEMIRPFPTVAEGCKQLREMGIRSIIVTSKTNETCQRGLDCLHLTPYVEGIVGVHDCKVHKPDATPSRIGLERLGLSGEECLCVGDSPFDLMSGMAAGCRASVKVGWSSFDDAEFNRRIKPDYVIDTLPELTDVILEMNQNQR